MIIIMLGAPGTGKGTVAGLLQEKLGIKQVSTGDIFRKNIKEQTELGKLAEQYISKGQLVPDDVTIKIVEDRLNEPDVQEGIILDGFPRTVKQAEVLDEILAEKGKKVDKVINLTTPEEEIIERIVNRRVCSNQECKAVYNIVLNPPKVEGICDKCGSELVTRKDDTEETVKARLKGYFEQTSPLVDYYEKQGNLETEVVSKTINKLGKDVAEELVAEFKNKSFKNSLDKLLPQKLIPVIIEKSNINPDKKVNEITKIERRKIVELLKDFELSISEFRPIDEAIVTSGGISVKEINPKTMESKIVPGLYFAGEIIDVDSYTGGFNLQIAYSTGYTAGK